MTAVHTGPEIRFGIAFREPTPRELHWSQPAAGQVRDRHGRFSLGGLAVLVDSALGGENHWRRPPGTWTVTTELRIDLLRAPGVGTEGFRVESDFLGDDGQCVLTRGRVLDDSGAPVAAGLVKSMEIPGPEDVDELEPREPWVPDLHPGTIEDVLCLDVSDFVDSVDPAAGGVVEARIAPEPGLANPLGSLHGGVFAAAAETVAARLFGHGRDVSSSSLDVRYLRPVALDGPVVVRAETVHAGRSWGVARVETRDARGRVAAFATVTVYGEAPGQSAESAAS